MALESLVDFSQRTFSTGTHRMFMGMCSKLYDIKKEKIRNYLDLGYFISTFLRETTIAADTYFDTHREEFTGQNSSQLFESMKKLPIAINQKHRFTVETDSNEDFKVEDVYSVMLEYIQNIPDKKRRSRILKAYNNFLKNTFWALERDLLISGTDYGLKQAIEVKFWTLFPYFNFRSEVENLGQISKLVSIGCLLIKQWKDDKTDWRKDIEYKNVNLYTGFCNTICISSH